MDAQGNTNHYSQMLMWILPFLAVWLWISLKYGSWVQVPPAPWENSAPTRLPGPSGGLGLAHAPQSAALSSLEARRGLGI